MSDFFKSPIFKAILILVGITLISLFIWFIGPFISFGGMTPFESIAMRITTIVMIIALILFFIFELPMHVLGVIAICILIWYATPLLAFSETKPFAAAWIRITIICVLLLIYIVYSLYKFYELLRNDNALKDKLLSPNKDKAQNLAKEEIRAIQVKAENAVLRLKNMRLGSLSAAGGISGLRRILEGKRYLYELPWYVVIGRPGAGKTTVLLNSGLKFPVAEQMGAASAQASLEHNAGTLNCAWWFTNDAVLLDTAGRYTDPNDQESAVEKNAAEWQGFLGVLRKIRARAPINGALLAVDIAQLLEAESDVRIQHAAMLRERLVELRKYLGIRFPVYVMATKADLLTGFTEYFSTLTSEGRSQVLGFTLPWEDKSNGKLFKNKLKNEVNKNRADSNKNLVEQVQDAFSLLQARLEDGVTGRLQDEYDVINRSKLYVLPQEFAALSKVMADFLNMVFTESRFDDTQNAHMLRGVYLTSAQQVESEVKAEAKTLLNRFIFPYIFNKNKLNQSVEEPKQDDDSNVNKEVAEKHNKAQSVYPVRGRVLGQKSYFVSDLLTRVIFPESGLVKPNLRWEANFRLLRFLGHATVIVLFIWIGSGLLLSHSTNRHYLAEVTDKASALHKQLSDLYAKFNNDKVSEVLTSAQELPDFRGLDFDSPSGAFTYGLYSAPRIQAASTINYQNMQDALILPTLIARIETVLNNSINAKDTKAAYNTLAVYLLLHDKEKFAKNPKAAANEIKNWVDKDWQGMSITQPIDESDGANTKLASDSTPNKTALDIKNGRAQVNLDFIKSRSNKTESPQNGTMFGGRAAMLIHLNNLFSGDRVVQSSKVKNEELVQRAHSFLDGKTTSQRLYDRIKTAISNDAPSDFTLVRAVGPQAGTVFVRNSHQPLEKGVPGLFTYEGYHTLFKKRLPELILQAQSDDDWVMGHRPDATKKSMGEAAQRLNASPLMEDIRRQYLNEYADRWQQFLEDIRPVTGSNLAFDLNVLRQLAAPDSPLSKIARAAAKETTLSRPLQAKSDVDKSLFDKAADSVDSQVKDVSKNLGITEAARLEKELVDNRFAALREIVTGQGDGAGTSNSVSSKLSIESVTGLINEFYTVMVVADTAANNNSIPANSTEATNKVIMVAGELPAPLKEVLIGLAESGSTKVNLAATTILHAQALSQYDRLMGLLTMQVTEPCKRSLEGRYPFAQVADEVSIDSFNEMFASGGAIDDYFNKYMLPLVDTSTRPWRYKTPAQLAIQNITDSASMNFNNIPPNVNPNAPTLTGELLKLLAQEGPNPDFFAKAKMIREMLFREAGAKKLFWKIDLRVAELDTNITDLLIDIDGQVFRYAHGPVQPLTIIWPGPRGGATAEINANPKIRPDTSTISVRGPWALYRILSKGTPIGIATSGRVLNEYSFDGRKATLDIQTPGATNPFNSDLIKTFACPSR